jgi:hypothetical protein
MPGTTGRSGYNSPLAFENTDVLWELQKGLLLSGIKSVANPQSTTPIHHNINFHVRIVR